MNKSKMTSNQDSPNHFEPGVDLTFLLHEHGYLSSVIQFADQKAAFTFTAAAGALTLGYTLHVYDGIEGRLFSWAVGEPRSAAALALIIVSAAFSLAALLPQLWSHKQHGVVFFGHIVQHKSTEFGAALMAMTDRDLHNELASQCYTLAAIAQRKFKRIKWALWLGTVGSLLTAVALAGLPQDHRKDDARLALKSVDRAAVAVVAALDLELPASDVAQRVAVLGAELQSVSAGDLSANRQALFERYRAGYSASIRLVTTFNRSVVAPGSRLASPPQKAKGEPTQSDETKINDSLKTLRQEAHTILEEAHAGIRADDKQ